MLRQQAAGGEYALGQPGGVDPVGVSGISRAEHHLVAAVGVEVDVVVGQEARCAGMSGVLNQRW